MSHTDPNSSHRSTTAKHSLIVKATFATNRYRQQRKNSRRNTTRYATASHSLQSRPLLTAIATQIPNPPSPALPHAHTRKHTHTHSQTHTNTYSLLRPPCTPQSTPNNNTEICTEPASSHDHKHTVVDKQATARQQTEHITKIKNQTYQIDWTSINKRHTHNMWPWPYQQVSKGHVIE